MKRFACIAALLLVTLGGCSRAANGTQDGPLRSTPPRTNLRVENRNFLDMTIFVLEGSRRIRLGTATGVSTTVLRIPDNLLFGITALRFQTDPIGGNATPATYEIGVRQGDEVILIIP